MQAECYELLCKVKEGNSILQHCSYSETFCNPTFKLVQAPKALLMATGSCLVGRAAPLIQHHSAFMRSMLQLPAAYAHMPVHLKAYTSKMSDQCMHALVGTCAHRCSRQHSEPGPNLYSPDPSYTASGEFSRPPLHTAWHLSI